MYFHTACLIIHIQLQNHTGDLALGACLSLVQNLNPRLKSFITARRRHTIYFSANLPFSICLTCMFNTSAISAVFVFFCCWLFPECFAYYNHWKRSVLRRTVIITEIDNFRYTIVLRVFFLSIILFFCSLLTLLAIMKCSKKEEIGKKKCNHWSLLQKYLHIQSQQEVELCGVAVLWPWPSCFNAAYFVILSVYLSAPWMQHYFIYCFHTCMLSQSR